MFLALITLLVPHANATRIIQPETNYWHLGVAAQSTLTGANTPAALTLGVARDKHQAQALFGISSVTTGDFGFGAVYRYSVIGDLPAGLHIGAGLGLGGSRTGGFFIQAALLGGLHFILPQLDRLIFSVDGGLSLGSVAGVSAISVGGMSPALGFSLSYIWGGDR